jgi:hypothetical protein
VKHSDLEPYPPSWGLNGKGNDAITRHILCCEEPEKYVGSKTEAKIEMAMILNTLEEIIFSDYSYEVEEWAMMESKVEKIAQEFPAVLIELVTA